MLTDLWLYRWLTLVRERAGTNIVLEIGCGHGDDTAVLSDAGLSVWAFDLSRTAVGIAKLRVPIAKIECRDVRDPFPEQCRELGVVVASLSLHYFAWSETQDLIRKIRSTLRPGGVLLCRLNSTQDRNFGASGHPELEPNFYLVKDEPKRFFDEASIESLFNDGWKIFSMEHYITSKYFKPKALWEIVLEKSNI